MLSPSPLAQRIANTVKVTAIGMRERNVAHLAPQELAHRQARRLRAIVAHAYATVPFYRDALDERGIRPEEIRSAADLPRLPIVDAETVRRRADDFTSSRYPEDERLTYFTSGTSTGVRREVHWDRDYLVRGMAWAERDRAVLLALAGESGLATTLRELVPEGRGRGGLARRVLGDIDAHRRMSIFPGDSNTGVMRFMWSEHTLIPPRAAHHHFVSEQLPVEDVAERMNAIRPRIVFSFGSFADRFFRWLEDSGARVATPRVWMYNSDHMSAEAQELAERRHGCLVYSLYSAMEAHRLGVQCERREGFHLNVDLHAVRLVDTDGRDVPPGAAGEIVVSNLHSRAMVLLNYRMGDLGVLSPEPCPCGRTLPWLERLEGRRSEVVELADGRQLSPLTIEGLFRWVLTPTLKVQLVQREPGELTWRIVPFASADRDAIARDVEAQSREVLGADTRVDVEFVEDIALTPQGKLRRIVRETDVPVGAGLAPV